MVRERWRIRRADVTDAPKIAAAHLRSWEDAYSDLLPEEEFDKRPLEHRTQEWTDRLENEDFIVSIAESGGDVLGFSGVCSAPPHDAGDGPTGELAFLYLVKEAWGEGLGRKLHDVAVDCLARRDFTSAVLWVLRDNDSARRFYETNGWRADGGAKDCFGGANAPAVRYARSLEGSRGAAVCE